MTPTPPGTSLELPEPSQSSPGTLLEPSQNLSQNPPWMTLLLFSSLLFSFLFFSSLFFSFLFFSFLFFSFLFFSFLLLTILFPETQLSHCRKRVIN
jgi:hypothetical protein